MLDTPRRLWMAAAACVAAFLVLLALVYGTEPGAAADEHALQAFGELGRPRLAELADAIANLADPLPFALIGLVLVAIGFVRGYPLVGLAAGVVMVGANVTTQVLKPLLANPRGMFGDYGVAAAAFPSGHATAAMSLALAAVMVAPATVQAAGRLHRRRLRAGGRVRDRVARLALSERRRGRVPGRGHLVLRHAGGDADGPAEGCAAGARGGVRVVAGGVAVLVPLAVVGWLALERLPRLTGYAEGHTAFAVIAAATAALVAVLVGAVLTVHDRR